MTKRFNTGDIIKLIHGGRMNAPNGALAKVLGYDTNYIRIEWIKREQFNEHIQQDGGYNDCDFELANDVDVIDNNLLVLL